MDPKWTPNWTPNRYFWDPNLGPQFRKHWCVPPVSRGRVIPERLRLGGARRRAFAVDPDPLESFSADSLLVIGVARAEKGNMGDNVGARHFKRFHLPTGSCGDSGEVLMHASGRVARTNTPTRSSTSAPQQRGRAASRCGCSSPATPTGGGSGGPTQPATLC
jgi:hypothetical protein